MSTSPKLRPSPWSRTISTSTVRLHSPKPFLPPKPGGWSNASNGTTLQSTGVGSIWRISQDDYDKKARELKEQQAEIATRIEQHQQGNAEYRTTLESLISLASRALSFSPALRGF